MLRYSYSMIPSSLTSAESKPFLDPEKISAPFFTTRLALSVLRRRARLPDKFLITKLCFASLLLPSFLQSRRGEKTRVSPTAWLDGVRGIAAFFVYIRHFASATHPDIQYGFGTNETQRSIIQLPFFHLLTAGPAMVALFFIVSGYALSWRPLRALHYQSNEICLQRLSSAAFRRATRLFLPGIVSTFVVMLCVRYGLYDKGLASVNPEDMPGFNEPGPPMLQHEPFILQLSNWLDNTWLWLQVWTPVNHPYDVHLWTLPVEFRCSMILFMALVAFARIPPRIRLGSSFGCIVYCHYSNFWEGWLFFSGSFLAQLKLLQNGADEYFSPLLLAECGGNVGEKEQNPRTSYTDHARICLFTTGLYLLSAPDYDFSKHTILPHLLEMLSAKVS
jgi:peptidoglycan/LPS O-acetylase OafA/YrhL